jgi:hypothetical protein
MSASAASHVVRSSPFSSLTIPESEVKIVVHDANNCGHVEAFAVISPVSLAAIQTRQYAIARNPWFKFNRKGEVAVFSRAMRVDACQWAAWLQTRRLWKKWDTELIEPGTFLGHIPYGFKAPVEVNIREDSKATFLRGEAPDLLDEYVQYLNTMDVTEQRSSR